MSGKTYFTADLHLGHSNVIKYDNRPFLSSSEMDETIVRNWNAKVHEDDDVYIIGDVALTARERAYKTIKRLQGKLHLIVGNHDQIAKKAEIQPLFVEIATEKRMMIDGQDFLLSHIPSESWLEGDPSFSYIYGHIHNKTVPFFYKARYNPRFLNAGIMLTGYVPASVEELRTYNANYWNYPLPQKKDYETLIPFSGAEKLYFHNDHELDIMEVFWLDFINLTLRKDFGLISSLFSSPHTTLEQIIKMNLSVFCSSFPSKAPDDVLAISGSLYEMLEALTYARTNQGKLLYDEVRQRRGKGDLDKPVLSLFLPLKMKAPIALNVNKKHIEAFQKSISLFSSIIHSSEKEFIPQLERIAGPCLSPQVARDSLHIIFPYFNCSPFIKEVLDGAKRTEESL